jgi:diguanylate cyclase (GGDEF)-like protein
VPPLLLALATAALASHVTLAIDVAPPGRLPWTVFDEHQGLPQHTIVDLVADAEGYVWAATQDGAARFDGRAWQVVPMPRRMRTNYPRVMRRARDGGLWFGTFDGGLAHLRDGQWTVTDSAAGLPSNRIRGLLETTDGHGASVLWIATEAGVARLQDGRLRVFAEGSGLPSLDTEGLCETTLLDGSRSLVVGTTQGLARFDGERFVPVDVPAALLGHRIGDIVESAGLAGGPALWITSYGAGMAVLEGGRWSLLDTASGLPSNVEVLTPSAAADGSPALWIGTEGGLLRFEHGRFTLYDERSGLPLRIVWKVLETTAAKGLKTLWLGTWGGGVVRLAANPWVAFDHTNGMPTGSVTSAHATLADDGRRVVWAGTSDGELARLTPAGFERVPLPVELRHAIVFSLLETRDVDGPSLWVASFGGGLGRLKNGRWTVYDPRQLPSQRVYRLLETRSEAGGSALWLATEGGVGRLENGRWTYFRAADGLPSDMVTQLLETTGRDGRRTMWAATSRGIARLEGATWIPVARNGLAADNVVILAATLDADGTRWLWAATYGGGASRTRLDVEAAGWETFTTTTLPGMPSDTVLGLAQDRARRIYLFTTRGVARLEARSPTPGDAAPFAVDVFTTEDGLPSGDCQQGAFFVDDAGRIWVGTARGLAMFDPSREVPDREPKPLRIESAVLTSRRALRPGESLSYFERNLSFEAALLAYAGESRIRYRYQLAGFDPEPLEWTASAVKEYTNLGAGRYALRVWGRDAHGNVSGPAELPFSIRPAPWLTAWALGAYVFGAAGLGYGAVQWRLRALSLRTRQLEAMVAERTSELAASRDKLEELASLDALTGLANRRRFDAVLSEEWRRAQRGGHWLSLALLDVDFFKRFNDRYGHARGDACLRAVAQAVAARCRRPTDLVARYGGEEFVLVLPETDPAGTEELLREVLAAVDELRIEHADSDAASHVTISVGAVSLRPRAGEDAPMALERADRLLYRAKEAGRHQALHEDESGRARV